MNESILLEEIKDVMRDSWTSAANAHRLYPDNKHTFSDFWATIGKSIATEAIKKWEDSSSSDKAEQLYKKYVSHEYSNISETLKKTNYFSTKRSIIMNITNQQIIIEFRRQVFLCSGIGKKEMLKAIEERFPSMEDSSGKETGVFGVDIHWEIKYHETDLSNVMKSEDCRFIGSAKQCVEFIERYKKEWVESVPPYKEEGDKEFDQYDDIDNLWHDVYGEFFMGGHDRGVQNCKKLFNVSRKR